MQINVSEEARKLIAGKDTSIPSDIHVSEEALEIIEEKAVPTTGERALGLAVEAAEGATFNMFGELVAAIQSATTEESYESAKARYEEMREDFARENPDLVRYILPAEIIASLPTGVAIYKGLASTGIKSVSKAGGIEAGLYGFGSGESFEERAVNATVMGLSGFAVGKVIDVAVKSAAKGGLKTQSDELADDALDSMSDAERKAMMDEEEWIERNIPDYDRIPLREAKTVGEFWNSAVTGIQKFYNDKITGTSDDIARYMPQVGFLFQRADETALRKTNQKFDEIAEDLLPTMRAINENERVKGIFLDYGAGRLGATFDDSFNKLKVLLKDDLTAKDFSALAKYLEYSRTQNDKLNARVFGISPEMFNFPTYLHTRNRAFKKQLEEEGLDELAVEKRMFNDAAMGFRTRKTYTEGGKDAVNPNDYDNPLVSDMQRLFQLEKLSQLQQKFNVDISEELALKTRRQILDAQKEGKKPPKFTFLTPDEFIDSFEMNLYNRGISKEGAEYATNKISQSIMGSQKAPHPLIQAASSLSYATTLAGPMSAVLNIADIPLLGAKYGRRAVLEGLNELNPFKKVPSIDLKKAGLDNQVMGEFTNKLNDQMQDGANNFLLRSVAKIREGTDFLMKGSGFAVMDRVGKRGVIRGVLRSAVDDANAGKLAENWGFYFNKKELDLIAEQFKKHGMDHTKYTGAGKELAEELMFAGLGQQQLISAAGRPAAWARNPNLRPLWALRGFVVKQQALALREVVGNLKQGNTDKAVEFLGRYALYGAGGYAIINESRQGIFGDGDFSASGLVRGYGDAWASLLTANTLGLNDYQFGQIKQNGVLLTLLEGMMPIAIDRPLDIGGKVVEAIDNERYTREVFADAFPIIKQSARFGRNVGGMLDMPDVVDVSEDILERKPRD